MRIKNFIRIATALLLLISFTGCGNDANSNTNGTVSLAASAPVSGGIATLTAAARVAPSRTVSGLAGIPVTFTAVQYGNDPSTSSVFTLSVSSGEISTDSTGTAFWSHNFTPKAFDTTIQVTVNVQGLSQLINVPVAKAS